MYVFSIPGDLTSALLGRPDHKMYVSDGNGCWLRKRRCLRTSSAFALKAKQNAARTPHDEGNPKQIVTSPRQWHTKKATSRK